jgi:hypothetical protein
MATTFSNLSASFNPTTHMCLLTICTFFSWTAKALEAAGLDIKVWRG